MLSHRHSILLRLRTARAKVLVFIPPPVERGAQPIHIKIVAKSNVKGMSPHKSTVLNPAVRVMVDITKASVREEKIELSDALLLYSVMKKSTTPDSNNSKCVRKMMRILALMRRD